MKSVSLQSMEKIKGGKSVATYGAAVTCAAAAVGGLVSLIIFGPSCGAFLYAAWNE